ncbi:TetR/AcrR family transcriptional regulator [Ktedonosporobacter rubrisoli]|uniref:TetR/AcrR family transcriptional regulator n=1 Tax=Ktedonosporobacter rubrisoli TaxID=2509675 RepID=A0A4P6JJB6_KTERU|nr:TetR/AcrR family transcriptional regulator [Ktedonosporobacter rubrisoli]QBD74756.1 TetR/AcrR family transcriptional regulator [Ktedonosporobacter rubrisoli]
MSEKPASKGLREKNKQQKLESILKVARELFAEKGYEDTTTREVAERAQIATGTLFLYVKDKQDLLLLVFYEDIGRLINEAFADLPAQVSLLDELITIFRHFFSFYQRDPSTAQAYIKEQLFLRGKVGYYRKTMDLIERLIHQISLRIEQARQRGEVRQDLDVEMAATNFFALYYGVLTDWLWGEYELEKALQLLHRSFELQLRGLCS